MCFFTNSGSLCIKVLPRHPVLHIIAQNGEDYYVDNQGETMPVGNVNVDLCVATGNITKDYARKKLLPLALFINEDAFWKQQIVQINITAKHEVELFPRVGDHTIFMGSPDEYEKKLQKMRLFYKNGLPLVGWNRYKTINLAFDGQIVCIKK